MDDESLARSLTQYTSDKKDGGSSSSGVEGWTVLCTTATRHIQIKMGLCDAMSELAAELAIALKWPVSEIQLLADGKPIHLESTLQQQTQPYQFQIARKTPLPAGGRKRGTKQPVVHMDLGTLEVGGSRDIHDRKVLLALLWRAAFPAAAMRYAMKSRNFGDRGSSCACKLKMRRS